MLCYNDCGDLCHSVSSSGLTPLQDEGSGSGTILSPMGMLGSGSGTSPLTPSPPVVVTISCAQQQQPLDNVTTEIFLLLSVVVDGFQCCSSSSSTSLLFILTFPNQRVEVLTESQLDFSFVADILERGSTIVSISVCGEGSGGVCNPDIAVVDLGEVTVTVQQSSFSFFPYGPNSRDRSFRDVLDGARPIYPPARIPFFSDYYQSLFVSCCSVIALNADILGTVEKCLKRGISKYPCLHFLATISGWYRME